MYAGQLCDALAYMHKLGVVHSDLKPQNLLLASKRPDAPLKVTDFGLASVVLGPTTHVVHALVGTPGEYSALLDAFSVWSIACSAPLLAASIGCLCRLPLLAASATCSLSLHSYSCHPYFRHPYFRHPYCSSPEYMSPEALKGERHTAAVDVWAVSREDRSRDVLQQLPPLLALALPCCTC